MTEKYDVLDEISYERTRQDEKWGQQDHPDFDQVLLNREGGCSAERMCEQYGIPSESRAKFMCENAFEKKEGTFAHILVEELSEAVSCRGDAESLRKELIQVAAVAVAWIEAIDRRKK